MRLTGIRGKKGGYKLPFISIVWWLPPRSLRLALRVARPPRSAKRAPLWLRGLRRPPPARPAKVAGLALAAPPFQVGAWLRGGSRRGERRVPPPAGGGGKTPFLGFPHTPFLTIAENLPLNRQSPTTGRASEWMPGLLFRFKITRRRGHPAGTSSHGGSPVGAWPLPLRSAMCASAAE